MREAAMRWMQNMLINRYLKHSIKKQSCKSEQKKKSKTMASSLSQEEENYVRLSLLLTGISPRAARALFDYEFAPSCLDSSLKKSYNNMKDLQRKRVLNQSQWSLLFPRVPSKFREICCITVTLKTYVPNIPSVL